MAVEVNYKGMVITGTPEEIIGFLQRAVASEEIPADREYRLVQHDRGIQDTASMAGRMLANIPLPQYAGVYNGFWEMPKKTDPGDWIHFHGISPGRGQVVTRNESIIVAFVPGSSTNVWGVGVYMVYNPASFVVAAIMGVHEERERTIILKVEAIAEYDSRWRKKERNDHR